MWGTEANGDLTPFTPPAPVLPLPSPIFSPGLFLAPDFFAAVPQQYCYNAVAVLL